MRTEERKVGERRRVKLVKNPATTVFLLAVAVLLAYLSYRIARPFLGAIAWATILAVVFDPVHRRVRGALKRDSLSALASTVITVLVAVVPFVLLGFAIAREAAQGYKQVAATVESGADPATAISQMPMVGAAWQWLQEHFRQWDIELNALAGEVAQRAGELALGLVKGTITNVSSFVLNIVLVAFTLFYFFRDGRQILFNLQRIVPIRSETAYKVYDLIGDVIRAAVNGVVVIGLIKGLLAGLAFWALGIHSPVLWGTASAFASVIPVVGPSVVWAPAAIVLALQGHFIKGLLLAIWGLTALSLIDNLLYPILVGGYVRLHTLLVFFSALGGLALFGFLGFVLGPVVATLTVTLIEVASEYYSGGTETVAEAAEEVKER
jgi:predicted PurR-regulated permease PerM